MIDKNWIYFTQEDLTDGYMEGSVLYLNGKEYWIKGSTGNDLYVIEK